MRTTLTLEQDVARLLERLTRDRRTSLKAVVNEALRIGLRTLTSGPSDQPEPVRTREADLGACRLPSMDDVQSVLAVAEGERFS